MIEVIFFDLGNTLVQDGRTWVPGAPALISELQTRGLGLGLISNTGNLSRIDLRAILPPEFDFKHFADELVLLSAEVGLEKPDPRIFKLAVDRAGVEANAILFCGEDRVETLVAQTVGMRSARVLASPQAEITHLVKDLLDSDLLA